MKDTLILKDGTTIELESGASLQSMVVLYESKEAMLDDWEMMTEDNLSEVQVKNGAGLVVGRYEGLILDHETSVEGADGTVTTTYSLREKTPVERRLDALEEGQAVQDGAISDLGEATSALSEQVEGGPLS